MRFYLYENEAAQGPFEIQELLVRPGFQGESLVCEEGDASPEPWKNAANVPEIAAALGASAVALEPSTPAAADPAGVSAGLDALIDISGPQDETAAPPAAEAAEAAAESGLAQTSEKLILIVDDSDHTRNVIEMSAAIEGYKIVTARNGHEATSKLRQRIPDLITTDLMMPGQGGYEFLRSLQASSARQIPVFVISGSNLDSSTISVIRQEGNVVEFFSKPLDIARFVDCLHKYLKTARPNKRMAIRQEGTHEPRKGRDVNS